MWRLTFATRNGKIFTKIEDSLANMLRKSESFRFNRLEFAFMRNMILFCAIGRCIEIRSFVVTLSYGAFLKATHAKNTIAPIDSIPSFLLLLLMLPFV